ncbi:MAG: hypothetical protein AB7Y46_08030 [Armatimonadota bacterium]
MHVTPDWVVHVPIAKAVTAQDGALIVEGIASDESVDLEAEIVKASGLADTIQLLQERGVLTWDHGKVNIGRVLEARLIPRAQAQERFPELKNWFGRDFVGDKVFYLKAAVDPPPPEGEPVPADLVNARLGLLNGHRLGFSLEGARLRRGAAEGPDGRLYPSAEQVLITKVSLCSSPMNTNSVVRLAKSLSAALAAPGEEGVPTVVMAKAITAGTGTDHAAFAGGRALVPESLHGADVWYCPRCALGRRVSPEEEQPRCPICGNELLPLHKDSVRKAVGNPLDRIAAQLPCTEGSSDMRKPTERSQGVEDRGSAIAKGLKLFRQALGMLDKAAAAPDDDDVDVGTDLDAEDDEDDVDVNIDLDDEDEDEDNASAEDVPSEQELDEILDEIDELEGADEGEDEDDEDKEVKKSVIDRLQADPALAPVLNADEAFRTVLAAFEAHIDARFARMEKALVAVTEANASVAKGLQASVQEQGAAPSGARYRVLSKGLPGSQEAQDIITKAIRAEVISPERAGGLRKRVRKGDEAAHREVQRLKQQLSAT